MSKHRCSCGNPLVSAEAICEICDAMKPNLHPELNRIWVSRSPKPLQHGVPEQELKRLKSTNAEADLQQRDGMKMNKKQWSGLYEISLDGEVLGSVRSLSVACWIARGLAQGIKRSGVFVEEVRDGELQPFGFAYIVPFSDEPPHSSETTLTVDEAFSEIAKANAA